MPVVTMRAASALSAWMSCAACAGGSVEVVTSPTDPEGASWLPLGGIWIITGGRLVLSRVADGGDVPLWSMTVPGGPLDGELDAGGEVGSFDGGMEGSFGAGEGFASVAVPVSFCAYCTPSSDACVFGVAV